MLKRLALVVLFAAVCTNAQEPAPQPAIVDPSEVTPVPPLPESCGQIRDFLWEKIKHNVELADNSSLYRLTGLSQTCLTREFFSGNETPGREELERRAAFFLPALVQASATLTLIERYIDSYNGLVHEYNELLHGYKELAARYSELRRVTDQTTSGSQPPPSSNSNGLANYLLLRDLLSRPPRDTIQLQISDCTRFPALCVQPPR